MAEAEFRGRILSQVGECYERVHARRSFEPGITKVNYSVNRRAVSKARSRTLAA
jgi:hypothetical protein